MKIIIAITFILSGLFATNINKEFSIDKVSIKIYDNSQNSVVKKPTNEYGNRMNLFVAIKISQTNNKTKKYMIKLIGVGKGRENDAEGFIEDYSINVSKNIILYNNKSIFIPFIIDYPCTNEELFLITLIREDGKKISKKVTNKITSCYLN